MLSGLRYTGRSHGFAPQRERISVMAIVDLQPFDIAPCGVNCRACSAYLASKNPCPGCRAPKEKITRKSCRGCAKKNCAFERGLTWCFECESFPCSRINDLNKRYQNNYHVNLIENGLHAREDMDAFLEAQTVRFTCMHCGGTIDQHNRRCTLCGSDDCL